MRTKTLLLTAVLGSACVATSLAQSVFSVNAVGYINLDLPAGFSMVANQLNNPNGNTLNDLFGDVEFGTTSFFKWNETTGAFQTAAFLPPEFGGTGWDPNLTLNPGEGAFIRLNEAAVFTLIGEVPQGDVSVSVPAGFSIKSSVVPQEVDLDALGFPAQTGDGVFTWDRGEQRYTTHAFVEGVGFLPPVVAEVGESFFVRANAAGSWDRQFSVND